MAAAAQATPIYRGRDLYVPAYDIKVRGQDLPAATRKDVVSVRYNDAIDQIDAFELMINNWDAETRDFKYTGSAQGKQDPRSTIFDPGQEIEISMGYWKPTDPKLRDPNKSDPLRLMLVGVITSLQPSFPAAGQPTLKVTGQNILRKLITKQVSAFYENKGPSEIAEEVGRRGGMKLGNLKVDVQTDLTSKGQEPKIDHYTQDNKYDIHFLLQLAHRFGYDVFLKYEDQATKSKPSLYFGPPTDEKKTPYLLEWGKSIIQFQPTLTTTRQVSKVTVRYWDGAKKAFKEATATSKELPTRPLKDQAQLSRIEQGFADREEVICDKPFREQAVAKAYALDRLSRIRQDFVTTKASTIGTADLRAGNEITVAGLGSTFNGKYLVTASSHNIGAGGYVTEFDARLEEDN